jgi:signal recognition particle subunit SRP54
LIDGSRRLRISKGSGRPTSEVNKLLEQFRDMQKMMKKMGQGGMPRGAFSRRP